MTPTIPKMFKELDLTSDTVTATMDVGKKMKMLAAAECQALAQKQLKDERWARNKSSDYQERDYQTPYGKFCE